MTTEPSSDPEAAVEAVAADAERVRRRELFDLAEPPATGAGTKAGATGVSGGD
jgi:hypothetical protein